MKKITYNDIKDIKINRINEKAVKYFNKGDLSYWNTKIDLIEGYEGEKIIFFIDNIADENFTMFKLKYYNKDKMKMNTLYSSKNKNEIVRILSYLTKNNFTKNELEILYTGEIIEVKKDIFMIKSNYLNGKAIFF